MKVDLIVHNARLVTCASGGRPKRAAEMTDVGLVEDGAIAVGGGKIVGAGKSGEILRRFQTENTIDARDHAVCPAFVDPHTHVVFAGDRLDEFELKIRGADYLEILKNGGGIISTVRRTREASLDELVGQSRKRLDKMLAHGTLTAEIKTGYGLDTSTELKMLEVIKKLDDLHEMDLIPTFLPAHTIPPEYAGRADEFTDLICEKILAEGYSWLDKNFRKENSMRHTEEGGGHSQGTTVETRPPFFADVFCEKNAFDLEQSRRILEKAKSLGFKLKAHVDEFTNLGGALMAVELGAVSIDHLDAISDEEIRLLAGSETVGIVTPTVNFNFGSKHFADARKIIDAGCALALSTDFNPGSAPCPSQPLAMAIACRYQKLLPSEAFNAATVNAAFAVGLGDRVGSLETGKQADILILDTNDYRELAYEFGGNIVRTIIKRGRVLNKS